MSEILKARNRILNRSKAQPGQYENENLSMEFEKEHHYNQGQFFAEDTFDLEPVTALQYPKKFNISSISMKFTKNDNEEEQEQEDSQSSPTRRYNPDRLRVPESRTNLLETKRDSLLETKRDNFIPQKREKSPEFSRTERINPIRHFEPYNMNTLSESNSRAGLHQRFTANKVKSRGLIGSGEFEQDDKGSIVKSNIDRQQQPYLMAPSGSESPIRKIRKTIHPQQSTLLVAKEERRRCQSPYKPRECMKSYVQGLIEEVEEKNKRFTDESFPPRLTIMYPQKGLAMQEDFGVTFVQLSKIYNKQQTKVVLINSCQPTYLIPGYFTNPYLLSAIRILAQNQSRVLSLFENQILNENGVYYVRLCKDGMWRYVVVDDCVPVKRLGYDQMISQQVYNEKNSQFLGLSSVVVNFTVEIWPMILQKAIAKVYSTYYDLSLSRRDGICPLMRLLTGYPVSKYDLIKDVRSYLVLIDSALKREHIVVLEEILPEFEYLAEMKGLSLNESYQILEITKNCFVLRNVNELELTTKVTFDEVMMFSSLLIFRREENYSYVSQKLRHKRGYFSRLKVTVPANTQCYWDVWQNNPAYYKNHLQNRIDYQVAPFKLVIHPPGYDSVQEPETIVESGRQVTMKKGEYVVDVHLCQQMREMDFTVSYYGEKDVKIERVKNSTLTWAEQCCQSNLPKQLQLKSQKSIKSPRQLEKMKQK